MIKIKAIDLNNSYELNQAISLISYTNRKISPTLTELQSINIITNSLTIAPDVILIGVFDDDVLKSLIYGYQSEYYDNTIHIDTLTAEKCKRYIKPMINKFFEYANIKGYSKWTADLYTRKLDNFMQKIGSIKRIVYTGDVKWEQ